MEQKFPLPSFIEETAKQKVQLSEDAWNTKDPLKVSKNYAVNTEWHIVGTIIKTRVEVKNFLIEKWNNEFDFKLKKKLSVFTDHVIAGHFEYEYQNNEGQWYRASGNEICEYDTNGLIRRRYTSIIDEKIEASERRL
ncbi:DUF1348 family protein [Maribacter sp. R77961]|uniref:DUF1348 family protein n=1 Tax=Maribacter sp. R77961 TaxID=3093871 RepID=UPI0037CC8B89